ncbi:hypothetical protein DFS33DRAFT_1449900 [Desarmillaria ectypa]|nr:hypothetical protein DFS33DRAFT_1449900 [Desarmillaria ectypa]
MRYVEGASVVIMDINAQSGEAKASTNLERIVFAKSDVRLLADWEKTTLEYRRKRKNQPYYTWYRKKHMNFSSASTSRQGPQPYHLFWCENFLWPIHISAKVIPVFLEQGSGVFINISSTGGLRPRPNYAIYNATKGAAPKPWPLNKPPPSGLQATLGAKEDTPENRASFLQTIPMNRLCDPEDIANMATFLASDEVSFITGTIYEVDGGRCT